MKMLSDLGGSLSHPSRWLFSTWFLFLIRYRRTVIGPFWIIATPVMFIGFLGALFVGLSNFSTSVFIPHMTIGFICWTLLGGFISRSATLYSRNKAMIMQGETRHTDIILLDISELVIHFLHQAIIIAAVCFFYRTVQGPYALWSILGLFVVIINGFWFTIVVSILGARFHDLAQMMTSLSSILFLATPIVWMPSTGEGVRMGRKSSILELYMTFNPFYHFLEIIRAPLMGNTVAPLTLYVVSGVTIFGFMLAIFFYSRFRHMVVFWS